MHTQFTFDSLGRETARTLENNPIGAVTQSTTYDLNGRISTVTHPGLSVFETYSYDGLDRTTLDTHPDNQHIQSVFGALVGASGGIVSQQGSPSTYGYAYPVLLKDEAGKEKQEWINGLGSVIETDQSITSATSAQGSVSIALSRYCQEGDCTTGTATIAVGSYGAQVNYTRGESTSSLAAALAAQLSYSSSPVTATASGSTVNITSKLAGSGGNYSLSTGVTGGGGIPASFVLTPSGSSLTGGTDGSATPTLYTYDATNDLTQVVQGSQTRSYTYDGLGRKITVTTPETGTETAYYTTAGGMLCSGSSNNVCRRTDGKGVTTTYTYDTANRLTSKTYSNGQGAVTFSYDQGPYAKGKLASMSDPLGSETYSYDQFERLNQVQKVIGSNTYTTSYQYNPADEVTQIIYPSGRVVQQSYDQIGQLCAVAGQTNSCTSASNPYATGQGYNAAGQLTGFSYGNGVAATFAYSLNRSQLTSLSYTSGGQTLFGLGYYYQYNSSACPTGTSYDNGQIQCITDSVDSGRTINYSYDAVGRLLTAKTNGSTNYPQWGLSWTYDQYGNRACQNVTAGTAPSPCVTFNADNQAQGYGYDGDGNMTFEPPNNTYGYDDEDHMVSYLGSNGSASYMYDGTGRRVQEATGGGSSTVYIFSGGKDIAEYDNGAAPTSPSREYLYAGNRLVAQIAAGTTSYFHQDHLSVRLITGSSGTMTQQNGSFPFGEGWYGSNGGTNWVFTTYERDASESGLDYANARFYDSRLGIFTSIDPLDGWTDDPLSWNAYSYVGNDPINRIDPSGAGWLSWLLRAIDVLVSYFFPPAALGQLAIPAIPHSPITPPIAGGPGFDWQVQLFPHTEYLRTPPIIQPNIFVSAANPTVAHSVNDFSGPDGGGYAQFRLMAINQAPDPDAQHTMDVRHYAMVDSEWPDGSDPAFNSVNRFGAIAENGWKDPVNFFHGADSWYFGSLWRNTGHLVDSHWEMKDGHLVEEPMSAHIDPYGPLNPLHYLLQIPSMLSSPGPTSMEVCSLQQGCH